MENQRQINSRVSTLEKELSIKNRALEIEAALEKVRSRSMEMHHSNDLQEVIKVIAEQFLALGLRFDTTNFGKILPDGSWEVWISTPNQLYPAQIFVPYFEHPAFVDASKMYASGKDFFTWQYTLEEKNSFFEYFFDHTAAKNIPDERKEYVLRAKGWLRSVFILKTIEFVVASYDRVPYSDEENAVFRRFAKVFEQAYIRFLDLQKAEEHARETEMTLLELKNTQSQLIESEKEQMRANHEKELLELEAKALRAQMNPHFIFNCLNSIKLLIQDGQKDRSVVYLIAFSKLIRTLFNNADKKEITLYDEIETCKLYLQLETMRFDGKFSYLVNIDRNLDLKALNVPALIIQPFLENAIWHGILPKPAGGQVLLNILRENGDIKIVVQDDGIGREASQASKPLSTSSHQSKGVSLTQSRLELDNLLRQRNAKLNIADKKNKKGIAIGTEVTITLPEEN